MDRNAVLLAGLDRATARILEIGSNRHPVAPKRAGWRTAAVAHSDRPALVTRIGEVDRIRDDGPLGALLPEEERGRHDAPIASHVIGRLPDPIGSPMAAGRAIAPAGRQRLADPDPRLGLDCVRPPGTTGQVPAARRADLRP